MIGPLAYAGFVSGGLNSNCAAATCSAIVAAPRATAAAADSSTVSRVCWIATGNIAATMMKPMPMMITANMTSVKLKPRRLRRTDDGGRMEAAAVRMVWCLLRFTLGLAPSFYCALTSVPL
jgi:hypothetical protein